MNESCPTESLWGGFGGCKFWKDWWKLKVSCPERDSIDQRLAKAGLKVGGWNEVAALTNDNGGGNWRNYQAPRDSLEMLTFAQHLVGWLPPGEWKLLQLDNSTSFDPVEEAFFGGLLFGVNAFGVGGRRTFLFEFDEGEASNKRADLCVANLIYGLLLFYCHAQLVSSGCGYGQYLSIQDGFAYFVSDDEGIAKAERLLQNFESNRLKAPSWVEDVIADSQP